MIDKYWSSILTSEYNKEYETLVKEYNKELNGYIIFDPLESSLGAVAQQYANNALPTQKGLQGVPFAIKNNIAIQDHLLSCASALLSEFISPITASAVQQLLGEGLVPIGLTNMDEFAMGSDSTNTIYGSVKNPWNTQYTAGGSSGGSAAMVGAGTVPFALGSDTGGSVRQPASFCGAWGLKPTYGSVSRYGLVAFASSLDVIGIIAEHPKWLSPVFNAMRVQGKDSHDASSYYPDTPPHDNVETVGIGICNGLSEEVVNAMEMAKTQYKNAGYKVVEIELDVFDYAPAVYMNIAMAEASTNLARFDGIRYGDRGGFSDNRLSLIKQARSKGFGREVKTRVITGGFVLRSGFQDQYYLKAKKVQAVIKKKLTHVLNQCDVFILPVSPTPPFELGVNKLDAFEQKLADTYSVVSNITGVPAVSFPVSWEGGLPIGLQAYAPHYAESRLCKFVNDTYTLFEHKKSPYALNLFERTARDTLKD